jgi:hypothetical protein
VQLIHQQRIQIQYQRLWDRVYSVLNKIVDLRIIYRRANAFGRKSETHLFWFVSTADDAINYYQPRRRIFLIFSFLLVQTTWELLCLRGGSSKKLHTRVGTTPIKFTFFFSSCLFSLHAAHGWGFLFTHYHTRSHTQSLQSTLKSFKNERRLQYTLSNTTYNSESWV